VGDQRIISKVIKRQIAAAVSSGTTGTSGKVNASANPNQVFNTGTETVVPAQVADDHGVSTWIGVTPGQGNFYIGYSRSMHYDFNTLFFGMGFRIGQ